MKTRTSSSIMKRCLSLFVISGLIISACSLTYSAIYWVTLRKKASAVADETLSTAGNIIESVFSDMKSCANQVAENKYTQYYLSSDSITNKITYSTILNNSIFQLTNFHTHINNISLINSDKSILAFPKKHYTLIDDLDKDYNIFSSNTNAGFSGVLYEPLTNMKYVSYYEPVFQVNTGNINKKIGECVITTDISGISKSLSSIQTEKSVSILVVGDDGSVLAGSKDNAIYNKDVLQKIVGNKNFEITDNGLLYKAEEIPEVGCYVVSIFPVAKVYAETNTFLIANLILFLTVMITISFLYWKILREIIKPILQVSDFMESHTENSKNRLDIHSYKEIELLADRCNAMLDSITAESDKNLAMQSNMFEMQLALKQAQISALQSQINPHFLYNTLDCIKGFGYSLHSREIVSISSSLSSLLRYAIKGPDFVHVSDELNCIECYMSIIDIRYSNRFKFTVTANPETLDCLMPRFILQPLIENSLYHGLELKPEGGNLSLSIDWNESHKQLVFEVWDDGIGIEEDKLKMITQKFDNHSMNQLSDNSSGIGLLNIARRIKLTDPEHGIFRIDSVTNQYTKVHIELTPHDACEDAQDINLVKGANHV